jgi:hypothetical protein
MIMSQPPFSLQMVREEGNSLEREMRENKEFCGWHHWPHWLFQKMEFTVALQLVLPSSLVTLLTTKDINWDVQFLNISPTIQAWLLQ